MTVTAGQWMPGRALRRAIPVIGMTQIIGWGTTYYLPAVLGRQFETDLGLTDAMVFAAVAVMLIVSAFAGWPMGRLIDRIGARRVMPVGSIVLMAALLALSRGQGLWSYLGAWALMGLGMTMCMSNAAFAAISQIAGKDSRRAIGALMLFGGVASTIFWPLTLWLDGLLGWRNVCLVYAALHIFVCLPAHLYALKGSRPPDRTRDADNPDLMGSLPLEVRGKAVVLLVLASSCNGFVSWGLDLHLISILTDFGWTATAAVGVAALKGPATFLARATDVFSAGRITPMGSALAAGVLVPFGLVIGLVLGREAYGAVLFIVIYSFGAGLMTIARSTLPLTLLGAVGYATTLGRLALPTQLVYAVSPMIFGYFLDRIGIIPSLGIAVFASGTSLLALMALARLARQAP